MQILAGSLNVQMNSFLHSGYISAYPRTYKHVGGFHLENSEVKLIDVKKAVELKPSNNQVAGTTTATALPPALQPASMGSDAFVLSIAFFFFAYLIGLYYRKVRGVVKSGWKPWLFAAAAIIGIVCIQNWGWQAYKTYSLNHLAPPWKEVAIAEYQNPEAATEVILHGLIANGLLFDHLRRGFTSLQATLLCSLLFASLHFPVIAVLTAGGLSLIACLLVLKTGTLACALQLHISWNALSVIHEIHEPSSQWAVAVLASGLIIAVAMVRSEKSRSISDGCAN
jgi:membrane protease YdiL (CAAX protease family)